MLTTPLADATAAWCAADRVDLDRFAEVMADWFAATDGTSPVHALETGEMEVAAFERLLADRLTRATGVPVPATGLVRRMFAGFAPDPVMVDAVRRLHAAGLATALLSNSWGLDYPRDGWEELFDVTVISGEVGLRKPDPRIYRLTAERLGVDPADCVFVDDLAPNVAAAAEVGMHAIHHRDPADTVARLGALTGVRLPSVRRVNGR